MSNIIHEEQFLTGCVPDGLAGGRAVARREYCARFLALGVDAGKWRRTISVSLALCSELRTACGVRVADHGGRAAAQCQVVVYQTLGLAGARVLVHARRDALTCNTTSHTEYIVSYTCMSISKSPRRDFL